MPKLRLVRSAQVLAEEHPPARQRASRSEEELTDEEIRAIEEGCADHGAGRVFTLAEIKREFGIGS